MTKANKTEVRLAGFGGQGIVLASVVFGTAAVTRGGLEACQTQSYGSEARGGECQAEVIVSREPILSPISERNDILVAMSRQALEKYLPRLRPGGALLFDPEFVAPPGRPDITCHEVPATRRAGELGAALCANMVMVGFLQEATGLFAPDALKEVIAESVPARFRDVNLAAAECGMALARTTGARLGGENP